MPDTAATVVTHSPERRRDAPAEGRLIGLYANWIFPRLVDKELNGRELGRHRAAVLRDVSGDVLEIGFGSGANLPYYPSTVTRLTAIEPSGGMTARANRWGAGRWLSRTDARSAH